jgi:hypothetical protein
MCDHLPPPRRLDHVAEDWVPGRAHHHPAQRPGHSGGQPGKPAQPFTAHHDTQDHREYHPEQSQNLPREGAARLRHAGRRAHFGNVVARLLHRPPDRGEIHALRIELDNGLLCGKQDLDSRYAG